MYGTQPSDRPDRYEQINVRLLFGYRDIVQRPSRRNDLPLRPPWCHRASRGRLRSASGRAGCRHRSSAMDGNGTRDRQPRCIGREADHGRTARCQRPCRRCARQVPGRDHDKHPNSTANTDDDYSAPACAAKPEKPFLPLPSPPARFSNDHMQTRWRRHVRQAIVFSRN